MVIDKIDIESIPVFEPEDNPPIGADRDCPISFQITLERVKPKARPFHIPDVNCDIQQPQNVLDLIDMLWAHTPCATFLEQPLKAFVPEALDH
jgi:hypothetical protein